MALKNFNSPSKIAQNYYRSDFEVNGANTAMMSPTSENTDPAHGVTDSSVIDINSMQRIMKPTAFKSMDKDLQKEISTD